MFLEDSLTILALVFAVSGIVSLAFLLETAEPVRTTIAQLSGFQIQSKVVFNARIIGWQELEQSDKLELEDGNRVYANSDKSIRSQWQNQNGIFEFKAQIVETNPKVRLQILEVKRID